jgi:GTP-binding protein
VIQADENIQTLVDQRYRKTYQAENGRNGSGKEMTGRSGKDLVIPVPCGTLVREEESGEMIADLVHHGETVVVVAGGRGGKGNAHFATATHQTPRFAQPGEAGEVRRVILELKVLADVGVVGLPNAGKSTFLSRVSAARPKIADYPFTTVTPHLGVVQLEEASFVVADIPGLIRGAHKGAGLGDIFLRHVERCGVLVHLVDVSTFGPTDPVAALLTVEEELRQHDPILLKKTMIVVASKIDALQEKERLEVLQSFCAKRGEAFFAISSVSGEGISQLLHELSGRVAVFRNQGDGGDCGEKAPTE